MGIGAGGTDLETYNGVTAILIKTNIIIYMLKQNPKNLLSDNLYFFLYLITYSMCIR